MISVALAIVSICSYLVGAALILRYFQRAVLSNKVTYWAWLAVLAQGSYHAYNLYAHQGFNFSFFNTAAFVALIVSLLLLLAALTKPVEKLGVAIFPIAALMLGLELGLDDQPQSLKVYSWAMSVHILTSIIAFSLLNIAALQAGLIAIQDLQLKSHRPKPFIQSLPSLQAMEALLFQMLAVGLGFLTVSLGSGFVFIEDLFAQHLVHKTVLSIAAWFIFSGLLLGRSIYGWRGRTAINWTISGFVVLLLAYFGSKFVLKLILHR